ARLTQIENDLVQSKNESGQDPLNFPPKIDNQLAYLYGYVGFSDGSPTAGALARYADLVAELDSYLGELEEVLAGPVTDFNEILRARGAPAVIVPPINPPQPSE
ncbi:MAG: hypothetical protein N2B05_03465, partial [Gemmatimonadales bacterium]